jgi:hypothetical protein
VGQRVNQVYLVQLVVQHLQVQLVQVVLLVMLV